MEGPDVFGDTLVFATEDGNHSSLAVQCTTDGDLFIALIFPKKKFESVDTVEGTLLVAVPPAQPVKLPASHREWNDNYSGMVAAGNKDVLISIIASIKDAKSDVLVGTEVRGNRFSENFSSSGSTAAMQKVIDVCKLNPAN